MGNLSRPFGIRQAFCNYCILPSSPASFRYRWKSFAAFLFQGTNDDQYLKHNFFSIPQTFTSLIIIIIIIIMIIKEKTKQNNTLYLT